MAKPKGGIFSDAVKLQDSARVCAELILEFGPEGDPKIQAKLKEMILDHAQQTGIDPAKLALAILVKTGVAAGIHKHNIGVDVHDAEQKGAIN